MRAFPRNPSSVSMWQRTSSCSVAKYLTETGLHEDPPRPPHSWTIHKYCLVCCCQHNKVILIGSFFYLFLHHLSEIEARQPFLSAHILPLCLADLNPRPWLQPSPSINWSIWLAEPLRWSVSRKLGWELAASFLSYTQRSLNLAF